MPQPSSFVLEAKKTSFLSFQPIWCFVCMHTCVGECKKVLWTHLSWLCVPVCSYVGCACVGSSGTEISLHSLWLVPVEMNRISYLGSLYPVCPRLPRLWLTPTCSLKSQYLHFDWLQGHFASLASPQRFLRTHLIKPIFDFLRFAPFLARSCTP